MVKKKKIAFRIKQPSYKYGNLSKSVSRHLRETAISPTNDLLASFDPLRALKPLPMLNFKFFCPQNGFPAENALIRARLQL